MIYLVTGNLELFVSSEYTIITPEKSLEILNSWSMFQYDSETTGRDCHVNDLLCAQFGNVEGTIQIVVDTITVDIRLYKEYIENHYMIGQNLKFDIQFLYNYGIIPRKVYDTMIVEQMLHLGYPSGMISYALNAIAKRRLGIDIDKSVRGEIIWRGLDVSVIKYAAGDVTYLGDIMKSQLKECKEKRCALGAKLECDFVPAISYLEWCGIKLDEFKWKEKMAKDNENLNNAEKALNDFTVNTPSLEQFTYIERQGSLFDGFDLTPKVNINWSSSQQVIKVAKILGFDTKIQDKKTGEDKDSVLEKYLKAQKGINDEFLKLYFNYQEYAKVCSTYGQGHLDCVNPNTGRIHTVFKQLGASSGRMSCGSNQPNTDLAKLKKIPASRVKYPNIQQLPANEETRSSFVSEKGNMFVSCDYSAKLKFLH